MGHQVKLYYPEAAGGTFLVQRHSSNALASAYSDFDCTAPISSYAIDAAGRAGFFVKELVDVTVKNSAAATVDTIVTGVRAEAVQLQTPSFVGTAANGSQAASGRVSLRDAMDKLVLSMGATDFKVRETGTSTDLYLKDALAAVRNVNNSRVINVKQSPYNAVGNGVAFDDSAILSAVLAAEALNGGTVYLPPGTFLVSSAIPVVGKVIFSGDGASSILRSSNATAGISVAGTGTLFQENMVLETTATNAKPLTGAASSIIRAWRTTYNASVAVNCPVDSSGSVFEFEECTFTNVGTVASLLTTSAATVLRASKCAFTATTPSAIQTLSNDAYIFANEFQGTNSTAKVDIGNVNNFGRTVVFGNTGANWADGRAFIRLNANTGLQEGANMWTSNPGTTPLGDMIISTSAPHTAPVTSTSLLGQVVTFATAAAMTPQPGKCVRQYQDANANWTLNAPTSSSGGAYNPWNNQEMEVQVRNTTGGAITVTLNAVYHGAAANIAAGQTRVYRFKYRSSGAITGWIQIGAIQDVT